jgi:hypothetical protein
MTFFTELEKNPKIHMETPKTLNNQSNPEKKRTKLEVSQYKLEDIPKTHSKKNSVELA